MTTPWPVHRKISHYSKQIFINNLKETEKTGKINLRGVVAKEVAEKSLKSLCKI